MTHQAHQMHQAHKAHAQMELIQPLLVFMASQDPRLLQSWAPQRSEIW